MKKIMIVTSTRADYGLLRPVIRRVADSDKLTLSLVVTGTHLLKEYGETVSEIIADGFPISHRADIMKFGFGEKETSFTIGYTIQRFTEIFSADRPDLLVVLGDRYEIFAVVTAGAALSIPIAHISGRRCDLWRKRRLLSPLHNKNGEFALPLLCRQRQKGNSAWRKSVNGIQCGRPRQ